MRAAEAWHAICFGALAEAHMARTLVIYFSRTGTTKIVAEAIAKALGADLEEIVDPTPRFGIVGYLRSGYQATTRKLARIERPLHEPGDYDLVVVGSPVWGASLSSPARTYLARHHYHLKAVAFFCTCGGRGGERVLGQMTELVEKEPAARLVLREAEVRGGSAQAKIESFCRALRDAVSVSLPQERQAAAAH